MATVAPATRIGTVFRGVVFAGWSPEQLAAIPDEHLNRPLQVKLATAQQKFAASEQQLPPAALQRSSAGGGSCTG